MVHFTPSSFLAKSSSVPHVYFMNPRGFQIIKNYHKIILHSLILILSLLRVSERQIGLLMSLGGTQAVNCDLKAYYNQDIFLKDNALTQKEIPLNHHFRLCDTTTCVVLYLQRGCPLPEFS